MERTAVLLDRHPLWLDAVGLVLDRMDVSVVGKATTSSDALELIAETRPDVFIAEPQSRGSHPSGAACLAAARDLLPPLKVVVLSTSDDPTDIDEAFSAGAVAYVIKTAHPDDLASAIRQAFDHSIFLANGHGTSAGEPRGQAAEAAPEKPEAASGLTKREVEILRLVAEGHSNGDLARMLWVTEQTVKFHLSNIYRKLEVANRTEASRWAQLSGLLSTSRASVSSAA